MRGFAVKLYTQQGNRDIVGNNIQVFFIQDAIRFPDMIHPVKRSRTAAFRRAQSAHDNFWDFISLMPERLHMTIAIGSGDFPEWELGLEPFDEAFAESFDFDVLDATKIMLQGRSFSCLDTQIKRLGGRTSRTSRTTRRSVRCTCSSRTATWR